MVRASTSTAPPAAYGTRMCTGLLGNVSAYALAPISENVTVATMMRTTWLRAGMRGSPSRLVVWDGSRGRMRGGSSEPQSRLFRCRWHGAAQPRPRDRGGYQTLGFHVVGELPHKRHSLIAPFGD